MAIYLGLDLGSSAVKALLLDSGRGVVAVRRIPYPSYAPNPGWVEQNPDDWWKAIRVALAELKPLPQFQQIAGIGLSGHMSGTVLLDAKHQLLRPCIHINDTRAVAEAKTLSQQFGNLIRRRTGNPVHVAFVLPRLLWLKRHERQTWRKARTFLFAKDYLRFLLTGGLCTEPSEAGNSLLWNYRTGHWSDDLVEALGVQHLLPEVKGSLEASGNLNAQAARSLGLKAGIPVISGFADIAASTLGAGAKAGTVVITLGNSAQVVRLVEALKPSPGVTYHPYLPGQHFAMASIFSGGMALEWALQVLGADHSLLDTAAKVPLGARGVRFIPHLVGAGTPWFDPQESGAWLGLRAGHLKAEMLRAVLEGIAWDIAQGFSAISKANVEQIVLGGGAARHPIWAELLSGFLQHPVQILREPNTSALGAALGAAMALESSAKLPPIKTGRTIQSKADYSELEGAYREVHRLVRLI